MEPDCICCVIQVYFEMGLKYKDIVHSLAVYQGIVISERHLKRILKARGLTRRSGYNDIGDVLDTIEALLGTSGMMHGYRWMYERLRIGGIKCKKEDVRVILGVLDQEGVSQRRKRRLLRRRYLSKGPNYTWHFDSHDKLKRYGICINGCIDGFSRHVIWLNAYKTSSDPKVIAGYFITAIESHSGCPRVMRGDLGTENVLVKDLQRFLRRNGEDERAGNSSYLEGASTANQRIEYWWSFLRRECTDFWICLF